MAMIGLFREIDGRKQKGVDTVKPQPEQPLPEPPSPAFKAIFENGDSFQKDLSACSLSLRNTGGAGEERVLRIAVTPRAATAERASVPAKGASLDELGRPG